MEKELSVAPIHSDSGIASHYLMKCFIEFQQARTASDMQNVTFEWKCVSDVNVRLHPF